MDLVKPHIDIGLYTNNKETMLEFWQNEVGLTYDHLGKLGGGVHQHRHFLGGGDQALPTGPILKINHARDPLPNLGRSGYRHIIIAREDVRFATEYRDPDGNAVSVIPKGADGIENLGLEMAVRDLKAFHDFYGRCLGFSQAEAAGEDAYQCGETIVKAREDKSALFVDTQKAQGYRYITFQIEKADAVYEMVRSRGGLDGYAPKTLGTTVRYGFVRDPDGNWIELSQRATLTGSLDP